MTVALLTGGSRGIGRAIAAHLARRGVRVALHYRNNRAAAEAVLAELPGAGHALFDADLTDVPATTDLWHRVIAAFGDVDVLINNAGIYLMHPPLTTGHSSWQSAWHETLAVNLTAPANLSWLAAQHMAARPHPANAAFGRGRIVTSHRAAPSAGSRTPPPMVRARQASMHYPSAWLSRSRQAPSMFSAWHLAG
jgi:NAD(P)-dependent dehydrogenase (short-subunit alcohol dehydrogenase family)